MSPNWGQIYGITKNKVQKSLELEIAHRRKIWHLLSGLQVIGSVPRGGSPESYPFPITLGSMSNLMG